MTTYFQTVNDDRVSIHLSSYSDMAICGMDLSGDTTVHDVPPKKLSGHRKVTCPECLKIICVVNLHMKEEMK